RPNWVMVSPAGASAWSYIWVTRRVTLRRRAQVQASICSAISCRGSPCVMAHTSSWDQNLYMHIVSQLTTTAVVRTGHCAARPMSATMWATALCNVAEQEHSHGHDTEDCDRHRSRHRRWPRRGAGADEGRLYGGARRPPPRQAAGGCQRGRRQGREKHGRS